MLTDKQLYDIQKKLKNRFYELREEIRLQMLNSGKQPYIDLAGRVHDLEEESAADILIDLQLADIDRQIEEISDIDAALMRIAKQSYGICRNCGAMIDEQWLVAHPATNYCYCCQMQYEKTHTQLSQLVL